MSENIAVIGLGYVGLPVAVAFARQTDQVVGFDISTRRIEALERGEDWTFEVSGEDIAASAIHFTTDPARLAGASFFVVTVPTPVDGQKRPDLGPLRAACATIGPHLSPGSVVVFESTVFPGATEDICGPALEAASGLTCGADFSLGYSPERINPGDRKHRLESIVKVVSGQDDATLRRIAAAYSAIIPAGVFEAASIRVAEAAKVIENTQRDINIALMNELALIFERLGLRTRDVLDAAETKWNFLPFTPGLVGGHCIGVDPYYLTAKAEAVGYHPQVILAGRRINDAMGAFVARKTIKLMAAAGTDLGTARVGLLGLTFKENVPDLRNSRAPDIVRELRGFGIEPLINDPQADTDQVRRDFGYEIIGLESFRNLDALILAVSHSAYIGDRERLWAMLRAGGVFVDLKSAFAPSEIRPDLGYWSL
ncbi:MAG: nucleotide sugar dehydrogenase [Alphaproteobacteria bacterium]